MRNFSVKNFQPNGDLSSEVFGKEARHYPDTDTLEVDQGRMALHFRPRAWSRTAPPIAACRNGDGSEIQLFGDAVIIRDAANRPGRAGPCRDWNFAASSCMPSWTPSG